MRVFDFDGTIYDGESLLDLYLFSARRNPKVLRHIAPVARYAIQYKLGHGTLEQMERGVGRITQRYLRDLAAPRPMGHDAESTDTDTGAPPDAGGRFEALVNEFWDCHMSRIKPWYEPRPDDVILTASFDVTVGEACRRLGVRRLIASTIDPTTFALTYLNFNTNKPKRLRQTLGEDVVIDEFYTDSEFDRPMVDMAHAAYMVKGNVVTRVK